jgi:hypothetical protein
MTQIPILEWDALGLAVNEPPAAIGAALFGILVRTGYTTEDIATVARTLYSYVDWNGVGVASTTHEQSGSI